MEVPMLKPTSKPVVGTFWAETVSGLVRRHLSALLSLLALFAAAVVGWIAGMWSV